MDNVVSIDRRNADYLVNKIRKSDALESNKDIVLKYYNEKLASGVKVGSMINTLNILSRVITAFKKPLPEIRKDELIQFFNELKPNYAPLKTVEVIQRFLEQSLYHLYSVWPIKMMKKSQACKYTKAQETPLPHWATRTTASKTSLNACLTTGKRPIKNCFLHNFFAALDDLTMTRTERDDERWAD